MTGTMLRGAVTEAIQNVRNDVETQAGVDPSRFVNVVKYALEVFGDDARKVRPCVYVVLDSVGGFDKDAKSSMWEAVSKRYIGRKVYKADPMAKLNAMLEGVGS
jgi:hypothetical protein